MGVEVPGSGLPLRKPKLGLPKNSCDSHCHVFGPRTKGVLASDGRSTSPEGSLEDLENLWQVLGFERAVIVQSAVHGVDHAITIDALRRGNGRYRGVAIIQPTTTESEVEALHHEGFRGARLNFMSHLAATMPSAAEVAEIVDRVRPYDWHIAVHVEGDGIIDYENMIRSLPGRVVIDHMARVDLTRGFDTLAIRTLKKLLDLDNVWVKLSGADRLATDPPSMADSVEYARMFAEHAPERAVWGTDYPHPNTRGFMPDDVELVDNLANIALTSEALHRMLVTNPTVLFDFDSGDTQRGS